MNNAFLIVLKVFALDENTYNLFGLATLTLNPITLFRGGGDQARKSGGNANSVLERGWVNWESGDFSGETQSYAAKISEF